MSRIATKYIKWGTGTTDVNAKSMPATNTASNYTPTQVAAEGTDKVSAHLNGINSKLGTLSGSKFTADLTFDGTQTTQDVNVSGTISDARLAIVQLLDNANSFDRIYCSLLATSISNVRIDTGTNKLPAGTYRLIVIG